MAVVMSRIQFNTTTSTSAFDVAHGLGVTPTAAIIWTTGRAGTTEGVGRQTMLRSVGFFISTSSRATVGSRSEDTPTLMVCDRSYRTDCGLVEVANGGTAGLLDITGVDSTNINFTPDVAFGTDIRVQGLVIGGTDNVYVGEAAIAAATGTQDFTDAGFTVSDDEGFLLMAWATGDLAPPQNVIDSQIGLGCATSSGKQWVWTGGSNDGNGTSQTVAYCKSGEIFARYDATLTATLDAVGAFNGFITNGFQLNISNAPANVIRCPYLLVKGGRWHAGSLTTQTDTTTDITVSSLPDTPLGGLFVSAGRAESSSGTATDNDELSIGAVIDASTECASTCMDDDNAGTAAVGAGFSNDACYVNLSTTSALEGEMHCTAVNGTGWTFRMTDADPAGSFVGWLAGMAAAANDVVGTDTGTVTEVATVTGAATATDIGTVTDSLTIDLTFSDTTEIVTVTEGATVNANISAIDSLTVSEAASALSGSQDGSGSDSGTVSETAGVTVDVVAADSLAVLEVAGLTAAAVAAEQITASEAAAIVAAVTALDSGAITEDAIAVMVTFSGIVYGLAAITERLLGVGAVTERLEATGDIVGRVDGSGSIT